MHTIYKKTLAVLFAVLLMATMWTVSVHAEGEKTEPETEKSPFTYEIVEETVTITGFDKTVEGKVEIPSTIADYPVTAIAKQALYGCKKVTAVTIPASVVAIGADAFGDCTAMSRIDVNGSNPAYCDVDGVLFSKDMTTLVRVPNQYGKSAFVVPDSVTTIGSRAFFGNAALQTVTIPDSVTTIGSNAFHFCPGLKEVTLPPQLTVVEFGLFSSCAALTKVVVPAGVTIIDKYAFSACQSLVSVNIPAGVTTIGNSAFSGCSSLPDITIPDSVTSIGARAFFFCTELKKVALGSGLMTLGAEAFAGCHVLTDITLPDGVVEIGDYAFQYCEKLKAMPIPATVTAIGNGAFAACSGLTKMEIPEKVATIQADTFRDCTNLASVTIPLKVKTVEFGAFNGCEELEEVVYAGSVIDRRDIQVDAENDPLDRAEWKYGIIVEDTPVTTPMDLPVEGQTLHPLLKVILYVGVLGLGIGFIVLLFLNRSDDE